MSNRLPAQKMNPNMLPLSVSKTDSDLISVLAYSPRVFPVTKNTRPVKSKTTKDGARARKLRISGRVYAYPEGEVPTHLISPVERSTNYTAATKGFHYSPDYVRRDSSCWSGMWGKRRESVTALFQRDINVCIEIVALNVKFEFQNRKQRSIEKDTKYNIISARTKSKN
ncbi:hypothetical protein IW261DRAFT_1418887 [Armillaria novae-zelandiae]|uniref:Uncharacterized protein n=1 Tax=Armillaria novae-zelandiae TaxID=153914 RepID=A0AA39PCU3_9AGAR|nr:hypothetical protein IW261DRAFT_1418873 [Armillaria novae-zelandiae]KAK0481917.1 hypothetical protein IW261DRAFT_1418882 [Armillaria novae-zelandiae]KAK0481922.1 hypothetical protein IW261DRAFT_1418887 [Armillaria novae-zelandiae]